MEERREREGCMGFGNGRRKGRKEECCRMCVCVCVLLPSCKNEGEEGRRRAEQPKPWIPAETVHIHLAPDRFPSSATSARLKEQLC